MSPENTTENTTGTLSNGKPASKRETITQNGVPRPATGSTAKIWEIADRISSETKAPAKRAAVLAECEAQAIHPSTAATQFGRWCRFHGLKLSELKEAAKVGAEPKAPKAPKAKKGATEAPAATEAPVAAE